MSFTRDRGDIVFECDGDKCHATLETNTANFDAAQNVLHRHCWKARKSADGQWRHYCANEAEFQPALALNLPRRPEHLGTWRGKGRS